MSKQSLRAAWPWLAFVVVALAPLALSSSWVNVAIMTMLFVYFCIAWNIVGGIAGQFCIGHSDRFLRHLQPVAQGGVVQRKQELARLYRLVGAHMDGLDHPFEGGSHGLCIQCNHLGRGQRGLAHRYEKQEHKPKEQQALAGLSDAIPALVP